VTISSIDGVRQRKFACDLVVASAGLMPVTGPLQLAQAKLSYDGQTGFFLPDELPRKSTLPDACWLSGGRRRLKMSGKVAGLLRLPIAAGA